MALGTDERVLFIEVSLIQRCPDRERFHCILVYTPTYLYVCTYTDGVVLIDPEYFGREGKKDRKGQLVFIDFILLLPLPSPSPPLMNSVCSGTSWVQVW